MTDWETLEKYCFSCKRCSLAENRHNVVIGDGNKTARIMLIGEGPGEQEDLQGKAFVGPAGKLLDKMLLSIGLDRNSVYIANIVKCRPPYNRDPKQEEADMCLPLLREQVKLLKPKIIVCLGRIAAQQIIKPDFRITKEHGIWVERNGYYLIATYHPSALLRDPSKKRDAYNDLLEIQKKLKEIDSI